MSGLIRRFCGIIIGVLSLAAAAPIWAAPPRPSPLFPPITFPPITIRPVMINPRQLTPLPVDQHINPNWMVAPGLSLSQAAFNIQTVGRALQNVPPYALGFNPYGSAMIAAPPIGAGYGGYGSGYPATMYSSGNTGDYPSSTTSGYTPSGYSAGAESKLDWPLALRILPPSLETRPLRERIDILVGKMQAANGKPDADLVKEANRAVDQMATMWDDKSDFLPASQQAKSDAKQFLKKLKATLKSLQ
jgi:hypothetical protein